MTRTIQMVGFKIGKITVIERAGSDRSGARWKYLCDCGNTSEANGNDIRNGGVRSCGCIRKDFKGPSPETAKKISEHHRGRVLLSRRKSKNPWSAIYRDWNVACLARDNDTCQHCLVTKGELEKKNKKRGLHVHHIKPWEDYPQLRFEVSNGITLCWICHRKAEEKIKKRNAMIVAGIEKHLQDPNLLDWIRKVITEDLREENQEKEKLQLVNNKGLGNR